MSKPPVKQIEVESEELVRVLTRTNKEKPKQEDMRALRKALRDHPELWRQIGDLARSNQDRLIEMIGPAKVMQESLRYGVEVMRQEMGYEESPALERLLIEQVLVCWLHFHRTHHTYINRTSESISITLADFWERKVNAAQRRYLRAVESLARVRKLSARMPLQVNIAQQQVNVAG